MTLEKKIRRPRWGAGAADRREVSRLAGTKDNVLSARGKKKKVKAKKFLRKKTKSKLGVGLVLPYPYLYYTLKKTKSPKVTDKIRATAKSKKVRTQKFENSKIINLKKLFKHFGSLFVTEISGLVIQENYLFS